MDAIQAARELGKAIQADERYIQMMLAQQKSDEDHQLQQMIQDFNGKRTELNQQLSNPDREQEQVAALDKEIKALYQDIFQNENMARFSAARDEVQNMLGFVNQIISGSAQGQNPDTIEYQESCGGDCGGCSGCS